MRTPEGSCRRDGDRPHRREARRARCAGV